MSISKEVIFYFRIYLCNIFLDKKNICLYFNYRATNSNWFIKLLLKTQKHLIYTDFISLSYFYRFKKKTFVLILISGGTNSNCFIKLWKRHTNFLFILILFFFYLFLNIEIQLINMHKCHFNTRICFGILFDNYVFK